ncbi:kelch repeat-containing protein [Stigmatella ashevillensis]|uniref:kelch repeat-containing protein n=1 Tax=Stigmatella ashevillensis TaxID=2995309 RepID=UPI004032ADDC
MRQTRSSLAWLSLTAALLALAAGCGAPPQPEEDSTGSAQLFGTLAQAVSSTDVTSVLVTVSAPDMQARTANLVKTNNQWSGTLGKLPAGTDRTFTAEAFNSGGSKLYAGAATGITLLASQTTAVSITLQEVSPAAPFENAAPVITSLSAAPSTVEPAGTVVLNASASDANAGDTLTYAWSAPSGSFAQPSSLSTTWTAPLSAATVPLTLTVTDSKGVNARVTFNVNVTSGKGDAVVNTSLNTWPQVSNISASATALEVNESTTVSTTASDNDGDTLAYSWTASCAGTWTNAHSPTAQFTATALPGSSVCNNCNLTVTVTDSRGGQPTGGQTTGTLSICVGPRRTALFPPDISETFQSAASTSAGGTVTFRVKAVDPQGSAMSFSWASSTGTPGTPTTRADSSEVVWTAPSCSQTGVTVTATVTNAHGLAASQAFSVSGLTACTINEWTAAGSMATARLLKHGATLLSSGKVLITGGYADGNGHIPFASAEVYDPASGTWSAAASMAAPRGEHTATLLPNGKVLVAGGFIWPNSIDAAEVYDPASGTWNAAASMAAPRSVHTATLLPNGKVLVSGGWTRSAVASAEVYDPASGTWSATASMVSARYGHTTTLLPNGKVLVSGGTVSGNGNSSIAAAEVYDPASGTWSATASLASARHSHTATLLPNGKVLVSGGYTGSSRLASAEVYDPASGTWSAAASMASARHGHTATLLPNGKVLVSGTGYGPTPTLSAEVYDPASGTWSVAASMITTRDGPTATSLPNGQVLVTGGGNGGPLASAELYTP